MYHLWAGVIRSSSMNKLTGKIQNYNIEQVDKNLFLIGPLNSGSNFFFLPREMGHS